MNNKKVEGQAEYYAHNYFDMHETNNYKALRQGFLAGYESADPKWTYVSEQTPLINIDLLVKSPTGVIHLTSWRPSYNIFTCQNKNESSYDWKWMEIPQ
jgi:hypothetical protein